jgi:hypothetical protein
VAKACQARQLKLESSIAMETGRRSALGSTDQTSSPDALLEADDERRFLLARMERLDSREKTILAEIIHTQSSTRRFERRWASGAVRAIGRRAPTPTP